MRITKIEIRGRGRAAIVFCFSLAFINQPINATSKQSSELSINNRDETTLNTKSGNPCQFNNEMIQSGQVMCAIRLLYQE